MWKKLTEFFSLESNTGLLALLFVVAFVIVVVATLTPNEFSESTACREESPMMKCYSISKNACNSTWDSFLDSCKEQIRKNLGETSPTALLGPKIQKCQKVYYDKNLRYSRRNLSDSQCSAHFDYVEANRREILDQ